jgi:hypothetical protein
MNKKAQFSNLVMGQVVFILVVLIFAVGMFWYIKSQENGAAVWEDYWSKEIAKIINLAEPGQKVVLDVHKVSVIAKRNGVDFDKIFTFRNSKNEVCVQLSLGRKTCYSWFRNLAVTNYGIDFGKNELPVNTLYFTIIKGRTV